MVRNDIISLITKTTNGSVVTETQTDVFAAKKSVARSEFFAAYQVGLNPKVIFVVNTLDWQSATVDGQEPTEVKFGNKRLNIIRSYELFDTTEVTCG